jgi:Sec-independent protein translocase protein TatA
MVVLLIALVVLGPDKLPNAARQIGKYLNEFRRISQGFQQELRTAMDVTDTSAAAVAQADPAADQPVTPIEQDAPVTPAVADPEASAVPNTPAVPNAPAVPPSTPSPEAPVADAPPSTSTLPTASAEGDLDPTHAPQA